jgi:DNA invertase Pin-like site-specific DNA recombinase
MEFINKHSDWEFVSEYVEKGVSGFKVHATNREKLEELKEDALKHKFDLVLVFLFDRLGRIEEETPFVLKWFVDNGIEMWSVNEGQRKFDSHVDNLLNYITFWQAAGESKKTQIRTLEAKRQMKEESRFQGCSAPFGYQHIPSGEHNKKGREINKLVIKDDEAKIVKKIYDMYTFKGYGARMIAKTLNEEKIPTKRGSLWAEQTVLSILKNSIYTGRFTYGRRNVTNGGREYKNQYSCEVSSVQHLDLVIVSDKQWNETKKIVESRANNKQTNIPKQTKSPLLFTGYIYCKKCGSRMTLHYSYNHNTRKDGTINRDKKPFYVCQGKESGRVKCDNKNYASSRIEGAVIKQLYHYLDSIGSMDIESELMNTQKQQMKRVEKDIKGKKETVNKLGNDIQLLKNEILNVLKGTSKFSEEILSEQIEIKTMELDEQRAELNELIVGMEDLKTENQDAVKFKQLIPTYKKLFETADIPTKKMLLPKFIERIDVDQNNLDVTIKIKRAELLNSFNMYND